MTSREVHHDVTVRQDNGDDKERGIQAILWAMLRNPVGAIEIIAFMSGGYALYYSMDTGIKEAKATSEVHYNELTAHILQNNKELSSQITAVNERLLARLEVLQAADKAEVDDIRALYQRGDQRYREIFGKLNEHDVTFGKVAVGVEYIQRRLEEGGRFLPREQRGDTRNEGPTMYGNK